jgi:hypothetical protein
MIVVSLASNMSSLPGAITHDRSVVLGYQELSCIRPRALVFVTKGACFGQDLAVPMGAIGFKINRAR